MTNRALLYGIFVNEKFSGGGTMNPTPFLDQETKRLEVRRQKSDVRY